MNLTQAIILLKNGIKKYGAIETESSSDKLMFVPQTTNHTDTAVEYIAVEDIASINIYLK